MNIKDYKIARCKSSKTSAAELDVLSKENDLDIKYYVALNENTSSETLSYLADNLCTRDKVAIARHKNTSKETILKLALDKDWYIRDYAIARL